MNTLSSNVCPYFSHVWGISKTFSLTEDRDASTTSGGATTSSGMDSLSSAYLEGVAGPDIGQAYINGLMEGIKAKAARRAEEQIAAQRAREQERLEAQRARDARKMEILVKNGMDPNASSDEQLEFELLCRAASGDDADSLCKIGEACYAGTCGAKEDPEKGVMYFKKAANMGSARGNYLLGCAYSLGKGVNVSGFASDCRACQEFKEAAEKGDVGGMCRFGKMCMEGEGGDKDMARAAKWLLAAARNGDSEAAIELADVTDKWFQPLISSQANNYEDVCYVVANDYVEMEEVDDAVLYFVDAALAGNAQAAKELGCLYLKDEEDQNFEKAVYWLQLAVWLCGHSDNCEMMKHLEIAKVKLGKECGANDAIKSIMSIKELIIEASAGGVDNQVKLADVLLEGGYGLDKNVRAAVSWWYRAARHGCIQAQVKLANVLAIGSNDVYKDVKAAVAWYREAAQQNNPEAQNKLGFYYVKGIGGVEKNDAVAFEWRMKAAEQGYAKAQVNVGIHYAKGLGCEQDLVKAFSWFAKAAEQGDAQGNMYLARCYEKGEGCDLDVVKAVAHYQKAVEKKNATACNNLAIMYEKGHGVEKNLEKALELLKIAAEKSPGSRSCYHLGRFYENGLAVGADIAKAKEYYRKAADKGDKDAKAALERLG